MELFARCVAFIRRSLPAVAGVLPPNNPLSLSRALRILASPFNFELSTVNFLPMDRFTGIHAVREALEAGSAFDRIVIAKGRQDSRIEEIVQLARERGIAVRFEDRSQLDRLANARDHQGVVAIAAARAADTLENILEHAGQSREQRGLIVLLDGVEDPHNLGAIIRTALAAGAHGVIIPERRAAGLTDTVARASAGALAHLPIAKVTNLVRAMEELKEAGYWLVGLDEDGEKSYTEVDYTAPTGIVMGGEGKGLHELTRKRCDFVVSLPTIGPVKSLNVSVATGVVLFEALRQRNRLQKP
jgi:23S rRNA (guanosine2251-2'-O)-methyltransferase